MDHDEIKQVLLKDLKTEEGAEEFHNLLPASTPIARHLSGWRSVKWYAEDLLR
jgi:hypothetical protein